MAPDTHESEKHLAEMMKAFGEASMQDNGLNASDQARFFALKKISTEFNAQMNHQLDEWLSPWGSASAELLVDEQGNFTGSHGNWFVPLADSNSDVIWSQVGFTQQEQGMVGNLGIGQRWRSDAWLFGYNAFYDNLLSEHLQRTGVGAEVWGESLRLSANYYQPLGSWREGDHDLQEISMARGYDVTAQARLPFYRYLNTRLRFEHYFGESVDLFQSGTGYHNPMAVSLGVDYTPVPLVTVTASHKQGESGTGQNNVGIKLNYRFGVPLKKQLASSEVAALTSLRGSRYDMPERSNLPVIEYRQRKTLSVFLATPPWDLTPGETVALKLQVRSQFRIRSLTWLGNVQALSLTPPVDPRSPEGWTVILPRWDYRDGATNQWHLSVVIEDEKGQRVSSNTITLALTAPLAAYSAEGTESEWKP